MASERKIPDAWVTDKKPSTKDVANSSTVDRGATTACNACGGVVAWGIKACPHCGKKKPAPVPPTQVTKKHLFIAFAILFALIVIGSQSQNSGGGGMSKEFQDQAAAIVLMNGYLCAEVVSAFKPSAGSMHVGCRVHKEGAEIRGYRIDSVTGRVNPL